MNDVTTRERSVLLSESAARRIGKLRQSEGNNALMLRLSVNGGGCSGFSYDFSLEDKARSDDRVFDSHGAQIVVDEASLDLVAGSEVDFIEDLVGSFFQVNNPNAAETCSCGSSFSV
ncbi:heme biosynthesis protein HemY [Alphaproteobacteria bacterium]|nr:heme biosynthesis protein HemY [Alphaproteobacteria bacterium]